MVLLAVEDDWLGATRGFEGVVVDGTGGAYAACDADVMCCVEDRDLFGADFGVRTGTFSVSL